MRTPEQSSAKMTTDIRWRRKKPRAPLPWEGYSCSNSPAGGGAGLSQGRAGGTGRPLFRCWRSSTKTSAVAAGEKADPSYVGSFVGKIHPLRCLIASQFDFN